MTRKGHSSIYRTPTDGTRIAGADGDFELMIVTSDERRHVVAPSPAAMTALVALAQADTVLLWDPADRS